MTVDDTPATWTRLIRFTAKERSGIFYGEPVLNPHEGDIDVGLGVHESLEFKQVLKAGRRFKGADVAHINHVGTAENDADAEEGGIIKARVWDMQNPWTGGVYTGEVLTVHALLAPVPVQNLIRAVGLNYKDHAAEMRLPLPSVPSTFLKPPDSITHPSSLIHVPACAQNDEMDYEVELAVVLSKDTKNVSEDEARECILGYTAANDLTARKVQEMTSQWGYSKGFDQFLPLGPVLLSPRALPDPSVLRLKTYLNGEVMQDGFASSMIFSIPKIISFLSQGTTLPAGTVIITGTPSGIGNGKSPKVWLKDGDVVRCWISHGIGSLINEIKYETEEDRIEAKAKMERIRGYEKKRQGGRD